MNRKRLGRTSPVRWTAVLVLIFACGAATVTQLEAPRWLKVLMVAPTLSLGPGTAITLMTRPAGLAAKMATATGVSIAATMVVSQALLILGAWSAGVAVACVGILTGVLIATHLAVDGIGPAARGAYRKSSSSDVSTITRRIHSLGTANVVAMVQLEAGYDVHIASEALAARLLQEGLRVSIVQPGLSSDEILRLTSNYRSKGLFHKIRGSTDVVLVPVASFGSAVGNLLLSNADVAVLLAARSDTSQEHEARRNLQVHGVQHIGTVHGRPSV